MKKKFLSMLLCLCLMVGIVPAMTAQAASNPYPYWQSFTYNGREYTTITCTYYAWQQVYDRHGIALPAWGNAGSWLDGARNSGYQTGTEARSGSLAVWKPSASNSWGHVAYVTSAGGGSFTYNEGGTANSRADSLGIYEGHTQPDGYTSWPDGFIYLDASTPSNPSVEFAPWSKDGYTYVGETDASIGQLITVSGGNCTETGMYLYDTAGRELAFAKNGSYSSNVPQIYFKINEECGYTLTPGTTYKYNFYAIVNGEVYWGTEGSFVTGCTSSQPTSQPTAPPSSDPALTTTEREENDSIATANSISVNSQITGSLSKSSDVDWYVFQVPSDGYISLTFDHDFVNSSSRYWKTTFYTSDNKELGYWYWIGNNTAAETGSKIGLPAGVYYLRVNDYSYSSATYRFTVNYVPNSATPSPVPTPTSSPTSTPTVTPSPTPSQSPTSSPTPPSHSSFVDVPSNAYYTTPVAWAVAEGITSGTSRTTFSPNKTCTRAEVVTFLWNAAGRPNPTSTTNPFVDVKDNDWYKKAVLWAVENNITSGTGRGRFSPNASCTRGQIVTFLWNAEGRPEPESPANPFVDVNGTAYYNNAVLWAVENGITSGTGGGKFSPGANCTRGQIVTFLYRNR